MIFTIKMYIYNTKWLALRTHKHNCTAIGLALFPLCMSSKHVCVFPAAYNVYMQTVNKSLINQILNARILSDMLKLLLRLLPLNGQHHYVDDSVVRRLSRAGNWWVRDRDHHSESTTGYTFTPCGIFYFPWHRHQVEGTNGF